MARTIPGFDYQRVTVTDEVALHTAIGGAGSPVVLLHGFPQTHLMWRHVAAALAADHTVICPDLRGYGASDKPAVGDPATYSKRTMAADIVTLADALGYDRFALAGHDRGALVAIRAGLDHPRGDQPSRRSRRPRSATTPPGSGVPGHPTWSTRPSTSATSWPKKHQNG